MPHPVRQRILITGASSGLGEGMARRFAAMGRDLALAARRVERLEALQQELLAAHPGIRVEVAAMDVDDPESVASVVPDLVARLGGLDRFVVNAGIGKGASIGSGKAWANRAVLHTNVLGAHAQCEAAMEVFRAQGSGHLVLISSVATVVPELVGRLGGLDRFVVNAGIGKGASIGTGKAEANRAVLHTNVLGAHAQCEAAMEVFRGQGDGHLVLISSVASVRGMPGTRTAYGASKAAVNALAEGIRSDVWGTGITVTTILPGYIATDINVGRRGLFTVDLDTGVDALTAAIEREPVRAFVPGWPWRPAARLLRMLPMPVFRRLT